LGATSVEDPLSGLLNRLVELLFNPMVERDTLKEEQLSRIFRVLSDPNRRRILELLRETDELRVSDISEAFSMSLNGVSKHLKVLEAAGLVTRRVVGREHWLRVDWSALQQPYEWLHFYHHFWSARLDALIDYASQDKSKQDK
jgi:DNA-binding transcriptional ArsR family regulator